MKRVLGFGLFLVVLLFTNVAVAASTYRCTTSQNSRSGYIPSVIYLELDEKAYKIRTYDLVTYATTNKPVATQIHLIGKSRAVFEWRTGIVKLDPKRDDVGTEPYNAIGDGSYRFQANYLRKKKLLLLKVTPPTYEKIYSGRAKCVEINDSIDSVIRK